MANNRNNRIYLDHAATTPLDERVLQEMLPYFREKFGNANSVHSFGGEASLAVDTARRKIAELLGAKPNEIYFTSGGTEADNWVVKGVAEARREKGKHVIASSIEHAAVLSSCAALKERGYEITYLPVNSEGIVSPSDLAKNVREDTVLVSVMLANNEIGTIQPVKELCEIAHSRGALFHTDAVQAVGSIEVCVKELGVDLLTLSAHKFYGPKGIGALYVKSGVKPEKLIAGGYQERGMRGGTANVPAIVGMAKALEIAVSGLKENSEYVKSLRDRFVMLVEKDIPNVKLNGDKNNCLPHIANISFENIESDLLLHNLDLCGIACSAGSACSSGSLEPSHVLLAMGAEKERADSSVRFSFGKNNTVQEIDCAAKTLAATVKKLREVSTLFAETENNYKTV